MTTWPINRKYQSDGCYQLFSSHRVVSRDNLSVIPEMIGSVIDYFDAEQVSVRIQIEGVGCLVSVVPGPPQNLVYMKEYGQLTGIIEDAMSKGYNNVFLHANPDGTFGEHESALIFDLLREASE